MKVRRTDVDKKLLIVEHFSKGDSISVVVAGKENDDVSSINYNGIHYTPKQARELARALNLAADLSEKIIEVDFS